MRLIDADALLEQYNLKDATKYGNKNAEQQAHSYDTLMMYEIADMIEDAPTVYDVEKVVSKLEESKEHYRKLWNKHLEDEYYGNLSAYEDALKIVRSGGKEKE